MVICICMLNRNIIDRALACHQNHTGATWLVMGIGSYRLGAISGL
jgi:hypothetical protein